MKKIISLFLVLTIILLLTAVAMFSEDKADGMDVVAAPAAVGENDIFVATDGNDANDGTMDSPLATFNAAKEKAKSIAGEEQIHVWFREGQYVLDYTLSFDETDRRSVEYSAYNGEKVEFFGGKYITGWETTEINGVTAWVTTVSEDEDIYTLFNDDGHLKNSRYPEEGYLYAVADSVSADGSSSVGYGSGAVWTGYGDPADLIDFSAPESMLGNVVARGWIDDVIPMLGIDSSTGEMTFSFGNSYGLPKDCRYWFVNVRETLNEPGEWFFDKSAKELYYVPQNGETPENTRLYYGHIDSLITLTGCYDICFEDLIFCGTDYTVSLGEGPGQRSTAAVFITSSECVMFNRCSFMNIGGTAICIHRDSSNICVTDSSLTQIGISAITVNSWNPDYRPANITVTNNTVAHYGRINPDGYGISFTHCNGGVIAHNTVFDGYYNGISASGGGISENYQLSDIKILYNLVYDIGQGIISDMGGIYMFGWQSGGEVIGNVVHDVYRYEGEGGYGGHCLYFDQGSSNHIVENNLLYNCSDDGITVTGCCSNLKINNNIVAFANHSIGGGANLDGYWYTAADLLITNNIFLVDSAEDIFLFGYFPEASPWLMTESGNLFYDYSGSYTEDKFHNNEYYDENPMFADAHNGDFTVLDGSPLYDMEDFSVFDYSTAGRE